MIRLAKNQDIDDIIILLEEVLKVHNEIRSDLFKPIGTKYTKDQLADIIKNPLTPIYVYEEDNAVVAHLMCIFKDVKETTNSYARKELYIDDICIKDGYRGNGIGKALYEFIKQYAKDNNFDYITLNVWEGNAAKEFYSHLGLSVRNCIMEEKIK